jgi:hypothetical protein
MARFYCDDRSGSGQDGLVCDQGCGAKVTIVSLVYRCTRLTTAVTGETICKQSLFTEDSSVIETYALIPTASKTLAVATIPAASVNPKL